jgi:pyridoxal biosynthesis lyase PdxS
VSIESVNEDLARLEADVRHLSSDSRRLAHDLSDQARVIGEEAVAAQFIATEETIGNTGSILEALAHLRDIQRDQLRVFVEDQRDSLRALREIKSPFGLIEVGVDHAQRRARHVAEGLNQAVDVVATEGRQMTASMLQMWKPFLKLLQRDWSGKE